MSPEKKLDKLINKVVREFQLLERDLAFKNDMESCKKLREAIKEVSNG